MLSGLCSLVFSLIILHQIKKAIDTHAEQSALPANFAGWETLMQKTWISAIFQILVGCCLGSVLVAIGRHFVDTANGTGMKVCCVFEGLCGCLGCLESTALCVYFFVLIAMYSTMS